VAVHLISLFDLDAVSTRELVEGKVAMEGGRRVFALLDFLPLGPERLALEKAAAMTGATLLEGRELFPRFPDRTDFLEAARAVGAYADAVILRHPLRGAGRAAAAVSAAPVLSAGDGTGEDPLFACGELAALSDRLGGLRGKSVALCGDLRRNRRAHSLAAGLTILGARVLLVPAKGATPGEELLERLSRRGYHSVHYEARSMTTLLDMVDSWLVTPDLDRQLSLFTDVVASSSAEQRLVRHQVREVHALWVASPRTDEGEPPEEASPDLLPWRALDGRAFVTPERPRDHAEDWGARAPAEVRALAAVLARSQSGPAGPLPLPGDSYGAGEGIRCADAGCVACREPARVAPAFRVMRTDPLLLGCLYCGARRKALYVGSRVEKRYHGITSSQVRKIRKRNRVFFATKRDAEAAGFVSSKI
jgi:hypothetical protein